MNKQINILPVDMADEREYEAMVQIISRREDERLMQIMSVRMGDEEEMWWDTLHSTEAR